MLNLMHFRVNNLILEHKLSYEQDQRKAEQDVLKIFGDYLKKFQTAKEDNIW